MTSPIADFISSYINSGMHRLHMPGHKGKGPLGFEAYDITEIKGADALYEADGIIAESETNAASIFGTGRTLYSTEGSSQCIRAMLYLAVTQRPAGTSAAVLAARNVHKAFIYAAALVGFDVEWLFPDEHTSICACPVAPAALDKKLSEMETTPAAVYVTSPDYLGGMQDIKALAEVCHKHGTLLIVDNAHGAYLHFTEPAMHPMDLGADICCDSAHKTLPVLTGGAYMHLAKHLPARYADNAKQAMALFGSTSPSYLILASLDKCNEYLASSFRSDIKNTAALTQNLLHDITAKGWKASLSEPLKLTVHSCECGVSGTDLAERLRKNGVECEFADSDDLVLMLTPNNTPADLKAVLSAIGEPNPCAIKRSPLPAYRPVRALSVREAFFAPHETVPTESALGRICAAPTVACPPAIPIAVSGEVITEETIALLARYGVTQVEAVKI